MNDLKFIVSPDGLYYTPTLFLNNNLFVFGEYINDFGQSFIAKTEFAISLDWDHIYLFNLKQFQNFVFQ